MAKSPISNTVQIACKLPNGLIIEHPSDPTKKVTLNGLNKIIVIGATYGLTAVDAEFATAWFAANVEFAPVKSCAIFMADSQSDIIAMAGELSSILTGFEGMGTDGKDARAKGVTTSDGK